LLALNEIILPAACAWDGDIVAVSHQLIDCQAIADGCIEEVLEIMGLDKDDLKEFCETSVAITVAPIAEMVAELETSDELRVQGLCTMVDEDDDLFVDSILDGNWSGHVESDGQQGVPVNGQFWGELIP